MKKILFIAISAGMLFGCGSFIKTKQVDKGKIHSGISYHLPKRLHRLVVTAEQLEITQEKEALVNAENSLKSLKAEEEALKSRWKDLKNRADQITDEKKKEEAIKAAQEAEGAYRAALFVVEQAQKEVDLRKHRFNLAMINQKKKEDANKLKSTKYYSDIREEHKNTTTKLNNTITELKNAIDNKDSADKLVRFINENISSEDFSTKLDKYLEEDKNNDKNNDVQLILNTIKNLAAVARSFQDEIDEIDGDSEACNYFISMEIFPQPLEPDSRYTFFLELNHSWLRDDDLKITTTSSGLLTKADVISTDRTGDIIVEIAKAIAMFGVGVPLPGGSGGIGSLNNNIGVEAEGKVCYPYPLRYDEIVDFGDYTKNKRIELKDNNGFAIPEKIYDVETKKWNIYIKPILSIGLKKEGSIFTANEIKTGLKKNVNPLTGNNGILYRRDGSHLVNLLGCKKDSCTTLLATRQISMPNISPPLLLP